MKTRKFKIKVETADQYWAGVKKVWRAAEKGVPTSADSFDLVLSAPDLTWLSKIFSPERMRLIQVIRKQTGSILQFKDFTSRHFFLRAATICLTARLAERNEPSE